MKSVFEADPGPAIIPAGPTLPVKCNLSDCLTNHPSNACAKKHSEHVIDALAYGLLELERNNPGVLKINLEGLLK